MILQEGRKYIYRQTVTPGIEYFEVFRANIGEEFTIQERYYPCRHLFPKNEDFGITAWSCRTFSQAKKIFDKLQD
jgi:hypothetical protein